MHPFTRISTHRLRITALGHSFKTSILPKIPLRGANGKHYRKLEFCRQLKTKMLEYVKGESVTFHKLRVS